MSDSSEEKKSKNAKVSELILSGKSLAKQIEELKKERFLRDRVVDLGEYRKLRESPKKKIVLVIDSDESARSLLGKALEQAGYECLFAGSEAGLAKIIESDPFDLILLDPGLPGINAFEFTYLMKGNRVLRKIPVVFAGQDPGKDQVRKAFEAGCDDYIFKPFNMDYLLKILKYFLENS